MNECSWSGHCHGNSYIAVTGLRSFVREKRHVNWNIIHQAQGHIIYSVEVENAVPDVCPQNWLQCHLADWCYI